MQDSLDHKELQHFSAHSDKWWDENGPFAPLHALNPVRLDYIKSRLVRHFGLDNAAPDTLKGLNVLDVGCGGGLVCEPLTRLGANVTGIDADSQAIDVAQAHARENNLKISYLCQTSDQLAQTSPGTFDVVLGLEIVEHVKNRKAFVKSLFDLCSPGGLVILSTLNRTPKSFLLGIVAAEYILQWLPKKTHSWKSFVKPHELANDVRWSGGRPVDICGLVYNPIRCQFNLSPSDIHTNYLMTAQRPE